MLQIVNGFNDDSADNMLIYPAQKRQVLEECSV